jgi:hypothetical protein
MDTVSSLAVAAYENGTRGYDPKSKIAYTIPQAVQASGLSRSSLYVAIAVGALQARKCGARTLILGTDLRRYLRSLPRFVKRDASPFKRVRLKRGKSEPVP